MEDMISNALADFEQGRMTRRTLVRTLALTVAAAAAATPVLAADGKGFKATGVNHISYGVSDYGRARDFYADLLGMKVSGDDGKQATLSFGQSAVIVRKTKDPNNKPYIDHVAYTIENWNKEAVEAELKRRGLNPGPPAGDSFIVKDPDGFSVQISSKDST
jgi:catechol 2,3-dioxygenase-like lactoylglutathione lyase family enzyme